LDGQERVSVDHHGIIFDIKRYAIHDGPGIRTTVFLKGCPLRCRWCQNPESWDARPEHGLRVGRCLACGHCIEVCIHEAITVSGGRSHTDPARCALCGRCVDACPGRAREIIGREVSAADVVAEIEKDVIFHDQSGGGATFSGGEPLMQPAFLCELLDQCRERRIHTAVDTTCHAEPSVIDAVGERADLLLCDLKHMDTEAHERLTGAGNGLILDNLRRLASTGKDIVIRLPAIPGLNDDRSNLEATGRFIASLGIVGGVDILPYNRAGREKSHRLTGEYDLLDAGPADDGRLALMTEVLQHFGLTVRIGG
jgi:pyruvate formate lyase activating enzyme